MSSARAPTQPSTSSNQENEPVSSDYVINNVRLLLIFDAEPIVGSK